MSLGPGKYDTWITKIREETGASGIVLIVKNGCYGNGFSAQLSFPDRLQLPRILREVADEIEADVGDAAAASVASGKLPRDES